MVVLRFLKLKWLQESRSVARCRFFYLKIRAHQNHSNISLSCKQGEWRPSHWDRVPGWPDTGLFNFSCLPSTLLQEHASLSPPIYLRCAQTALYSYLIISHSLMCRSLPSQGWEPGAKKTTWSSMQQRLRGWSWTSGVRSPSTSMAKAVEIVQSFKYLGVNISHDLTRTVNPTATVRKGHQRLYFLRCLKTAQLPNQLLVSFYRSVLMYCISTRYSSCTQENRKEQRRGSQAPSSPG